MHKIKKNSQFKHLLSYLCSIVNKILAHAILKVFLVFVLFKFKKTSQHFRNSGCKSQPLQIDNRSKTLSVSILFWLIVPLEVIEKVIFYADFVSFR